MRDFAHPGRRLEAADDTEHVGRRCCIGKGLDFRSVQIDCLIGIDFERLSPLRLAHTDGHTKRVSLRIAAEKRLRKTHEPRAGGCGLGDKRGSLAGRGERVARDGAGLCDSDL